MKIFQSSTSNFADGKRPSLKPSHFVGLNCVSWDLRSSLWSWLIKITFFHRFEWFSISFMAKKDIFFMTKLFLFLLFSAQYGNWLLSAATVDNQMGTRVNKRRELSNPDVKKSLDRLWDSRPFCDRPTPGFFWGGL